LLATGCRLAMPLALAGLPMSALRRSVERSIWPGAEGDRWML